MGNETRTDTSAEPKPTRGGAQKFAILSIVLLLVVLCSEGCKSATKDAASNRAAKDAAATSIRAAKETIATAALAAKPGSQELAEIQKSTPELDEATSLYAKGSATQTGP